jgi:hypothetical protein
MNLLTIINQQTNKYCFFRKIIITSAISIDSIKNIDGFFDEIIKEPRVNPGF